jgi:glycosyltransferase involved in cell wall biosynthesis
MYSDKRISVVIPCHNEEEGIRAVIERMPALIDEILVVDNASTDRTAEVASGLGARVVTEARKGYGRAYKTGFAAASGDIIVTMDGDGTYPPDAIQLLLHVFFEGEIDFMTARRWRPLRGRRRFSLRILGNAILSSLTMVLFRRFIWDSQSGMWVFKSEHLPKLQPWSDSMALSQEIKILAFTQPSLRCLEMPIFYGEHRIGESKLNMWRDGFGNLFHLFKMRLTFGRRRRAAIATAVPVAMAVEKKKVGSEDTVAYA